MDRPNQGQVQAGFLFGILVAEYVHKIKRNFSDGKTDQILDVVNQVAEGTLTLSDTPEEVAADLPGLPENLRASLPRLLKHGREEQRKTAQELVRQILGET